MSKVTARLQEIPFIFKPVELKILFETPEEVAAFKTHAKWFAEYYAHDAGRRIQQKLLENIKTVLEKY